MAEAQGGKEGTKVKLPPNQKHKQVPLSQLSREVSETAVQKVCGSQTFALLCLMLREHSLVFFSYLYYEDHQVCLCLS